MQNFRRLGWVELGYFMVEDNKKQKKTKQLIDFRGYPSPQLELELSWQVGAKVDQLLLNSKYRLANYFPTELPVIDKKKVAEHRLITRFPGALLVQARWKLLFIQGLCLNFLVAE